MRASFILTGVIAASLAIASCGGVGALGGKDCSWTYVSANWGGLTLADTSSQSRHVMLRFAFGTSPITEMNSAECLRRLRATVNAKRILVIAERSVCGSPSTERLSIDLEVPAGGHYEVVYGDAASGYPRLGIVEVK